MPRWKMGEREKYETLRFIIISIIIIIIIVV